MAVTQNKTVSAQGIKTAQATCTAAKTTYGDTTNAVLLLTGGQNGSIIYEVVGRPKGTTGGAGRLDAFSSLNGTAAVAIKGADFANYTYSATAGPTETTLSWSETKPRRVAPLEQIWVGTSIAATAGFAVDAQYEDL